MSNDLSKIGVVATVRAASGTHLATKAGWVAPLRLDNHNFATKAGMVAVLRTSSRHENTKFAAVAVLRPSATGRRRAMFVS